MIWLSSDFNRMAENVLKEYNPDKALFSTLIYGPIGVGKSNLLTKLYDRLKSRNKILYVDTHDFVKNYAFAAQEGYLPQFRQRLRSPSLLIMDHIEVLKGKSHSIEEFYHTYEALFQSNSRIICGFRGEPAELSFLGNKLSSRLLGGLAIPVLQPSQEDMLIYFRHLSHRKLLIIEDLVLELMSKEISNFLEAQAIMNDFIRYANQIESALDEGAFRLYLEERKKKEHHLPSPQNIVQKAAALLGVASEEIYRTSRAAEVRLARQLAIYGIRQLCKLSYPEIGQLMNKSHSSIMKSYLQFQESLEHSSELKEKLKELLEFFDFQGNIN